MKTTIATVLMFVISLLLIQPAKAFTTAIAVTGQSGVTVTASIETGFTGSSINLGIPGAVALSFDNAATGGYIYLTLTNSIFSKKLVDGTYAVDTAFPSTIPGAISGELGIFDNTNAGATGLVTLSGVSYDSFTSKLTSFAADGNLTVNGQEYFVSARYNSPTALAPAPVPEPSAFLLSLLGILPVLTRRKR